MRDRTSERSEEVRLDQDQPILPLAGDLLGDSSSIDLEEELEAEKGWCYSLLVVLYVLTGMCRGIRLKYFRY